jgi:hypothetical protein
MSALQFVLWLLEVAFWAAVIYFALWFTLHGLGLGFLMLFNRWLDRLDK